MMKRKTFMSLALASMMLLMMVIPASAAKPSQEYVKSHGHLYKLVEMIPNSDGYTWDDANYAADGATYVDVKKGITYVGHLLTINSKQENAFIYRKFCKQYSYMWIGLSNESGNLAWVTGEALDYTNWYPGEPRMASPAPYHGCMLNTGEWRTLSDAVHLPYYIIEYEPAQP